MRFNIFQFFPGIFVVRKTTIFKGCIKKQCQNIAISVKIGWWTDWEIFETVKSYSSKLLKYLSIEEQKTSIIGKKEKTQIFAKPCCD